jgi:hypothetical protein
MRAHVAFTSAALSCLLAGCAEFELYDKHDKEIKGFKYYTAKPYVLIGHTGKTDEPYTITPTYLPDLDNPVYAKAKPGWIGNSNLKMQFNDNGTLHDFGQEGNNNIAELVNSLGTFAKNLADARAVRPPATSTSLSKAEAKAYETDIIAATADMKQTLADQLGKNQISRADHDAALKQVLRIEATAREIADEARPEADRQAASLRIHALVAGFRAHPEIGKKREFAAPVAVIERVASRIGQLENAHFTLYEVIMLGDKPQLREVAIMPPEKPYP